MTESTNKDKKKYSDQWKHVHLSELYMFYPHIWRDVTSKTIPRKPYVPVDKISDHPHKLSFQQWKLILTTYLDVVMEDLLKGFLFKIPYNLGYLRLAKYTFTYPGKNMGLYKWCRKFADGYYFKLHWINRGRNLVSAKNKMFFKFMFTRNKYAELKRMIEKDRSIIYNFPTHTSYGSK